MCSRATSSRSLNKGTLLECDKKRGRLSVKLGRGDGRDLRSANSVGTFTRRFQDNVIFVSFFRSDELYESLRAFRQRWWTRSCCTHTVEVGQLSEIRTRKKGMVPRVSLTCACVISYSFESTLHRTPTKHLISVREGSAQLAVARNESRVDEYGILKLSCCKRWKKMRQFIYFLPQCLYCRSSTDRYWYADRTMFLNCSWSRRSPAPSAWTLGLNLVAVQISLELAVPLFSLLRPFLFSHLVPNFLLGTIIFLL